LSLRIFIEKETEGETEGTIACCIYILEKKHENSIVSISSFKTFVDTQQDDMIF